MCLYRKKRLVHKQNKGYNIKVRATQYTQHIYNSNQESNMVKLASKWRFEQNNKHLVIK